jgi:tetratricopeptide (TPR) repeat protein
MKNRWVTLAIAAIALPAWLGLGGCTTFQELTLQPQLKEADAAFNGGDYALAATRYESLSDRYPMTSRRQLLRIRQGISLYTAASYHDARDVFLLYLKEFPTGRYTQDAEAYLKKIDVMMSPDSPARRETIEAAKADLNKLQQLRMQHPHDPAVAYSIGNLFYEMGNYDEAVRNYYEALSLDAAYKEKDMIRQRLILDDAGKPRALTPGEIKRVERDNRPLVVFDTHNYTARDQNMLISGQKRFYNVTGLVRNQSSRMLHDIEVEVRFINAQHQVLDVDKVYIGSMGPDEVRPFRAEANSYDDLYNIVSFETNPSWRR